MGEGERVRRVRNRREGTDEYSRGERDRETERQRGEDRQTEDLVRVKEYTFLHCDDELVTSLRAGGNPHKLIVAPLQVVDRGGE